MKTFLLLPLLLTSLQAFSLRSDIQHAYRHQEWEEVEKMVDQFFSSLGNRDLIHPEYFGRLKFKLGVALWHQGKWESACRAFAHSYKKSRNRLDNPDKITTLWGWSDCAHRLGDYGLSIRMAKKYLAEQDNREQRKQSPFVNGPRILGYDPFYR